MALEGPPGQILVFQISNTSTWNFTLDLKIQNTFKYFLFKLWYILSGPCSWCIPHDHLTDDAAALDLPTVSDVDVITISAFRLEEMK